MATIDLPVQKLIWSSIDQRNLHKIFFQFEISQSNSNLKILLVAYPAYMPHWKVIRVDLPVIPGETPVTLNLPLTFGNIELNEPEIQKIKNSGKTEFIMRPYLYSQNPHASYELLDGTTSIVSANPSPPAKPG